MLTLCQRINFYITIRFFRFYEEAFIFHKMKNILRGFEDIAKLFAFQIFIQKIYSIKVSAGNNMYFAIPLAAVAVCIVINFSRKRNHPIRMFEMEGGNELING